MQRDAKEEVHVRIGACLWSLVLANPLSGASQDRKYTQHVKQTSSRRVREACLSAHANRHGDSVMPKAHVASC